MGKLKRIKNIKVDKKKVGIGLLGLGALGVSLLKKKRNKQRQREMDKAFYDLTNIHNQCRLHQEIENEYFHEELEDIKEEVICLYEHMETLHDINGIKGNGKTTCHYETIEDNQVKNIENSEV